MKCPKCGSEYKTGGTDVNGNAVCKACQLKELKDLGFLNDKNITQTTSSNKIIIETEITTAEMLLWLIKNIPLDCDTQSIAFAFGWKEVVFDGDIDNQIKQAYLKAKKEEQNAKN